MSKAEAPKLVDDRMRPCKRDPQLQSHRADSSDVKMARNVRYHAHGGGKVSEELKQLHVGGIDGISCQHLPVLMTHLSQKNIVNGRKQGW